MNYIQNRTFTTSDGNTYTVIGTRSTGYKHYEAIDTIKSHRTGKTKEMARAKTLKFIQS